LSPKKTVEGALGGLLATVLAGYACKLVFFPALTSFQALWIAALLSASGQLGDLLESLVKRSYGIKDSGRMLPGHGGILDRIDSILLAGPAGYYLAILI
jgi:phosphatidate cytidylyltransferase